jgi:hypothetical protein
MAAQVDSVSPCRAVHARRWLTTFVSASGLTDGVRRFSFNEVVGARALAASGALEHLVDR